MNADTKKQGPLCENVQLVILQGFLILFLNKALYKALYKAL